MKVFTKKNLLIIFLTLISGGIASAEPELKYYLMSGPTMTGGARSGPGVAAGAFLSTCEDSYSCHGYAQFVGHTSGKVKVTYADTLIGYHFGGLLGGFTGLGIRTAENKDLISEIAYGIGIGPIIISFKRYKENDRNRAETTFAAYWSMRLN